VPKQEENNIKTDQDSTSLEETVQAIEVLLEEVDTHACLDEKVL